MPSITVDISKKGGAPAAPALNLNVLVNPPGRRQNHVDPDMVARVLDTIEALTAAYTMFLGPVKEHYPDEVIDVSRDYAAAVPEADAVYQSAEVGKLPNYPKWWPSFIVTDRKPQKGQTLKGLMLLDVDGRQVMGDEHETSFLTDISGNMVKTASRTYHVIYR